MHRDNNAFDLNTLIIFKRVVELNSLSKTAEELEINASTVSRKISDLEIFYGVKLLIRTTRTLTLTQEGKKFYSYCSTIEDLLKRSEDEIMHTQSEPTGVLRLVIPVDLGNLLLQEPLNAFALAYPKVVLDLEFSNRTVDIIEEGIDICFSIGEPINQSLIAKRLFTYKRYLMASHDYLAHYGEIRSIGDIHAPHRQIRNKNPFVYEHCTLLKNLPHSIAVNSSYAVLQACISGLGLAFVSKALQEKYDHNKQLVRVLENEIASETSLNMLYVERKLKPMRTEFFLNYITQYFEKKYLIATEPHLI